jgi:hypothetical protein
MTNTLTPGIAAGSPTPPEAIVTVAIAGIWRVERDGATLGYVQETGQRFVSLLGRVYNTSVEVSQSLTLDNAVRRLLAI